MIKVSVLYPNSAGGRFDIAYYVDKHMPMVRQGDIPNFTNTQPTVQVSEVKL